MKKHTSCGRIYVCHTFYHAYISVLKELALPKEYQGNATILLSQMSNNFGSLKERLEASKLFKNVMDFDEKSESFFPELAKLRENKGNMLANSISRIKFTKKFAKLQEPFVPVDFSNYEDIYVFCDNDPIGIYLSQHKFYYHALEDGLNCLRVYVPAYKDNEGAFKLKKFLSDNLNLIFIRDGFNKYCLDMEVNDVSVISYPCKKYREIPRESLTNRLTADDKRILMDIFIENLPKLKEMTSSLDKEKENILILTEPLCDLDTRARIFDDLVKEYSKEGNIFLKPHPRDELNYSELFPNVPQFSASIPMELLNFFEEVRFKKVISIFTQIDAIYFADEKIKLGPKFMDKYEDPSIHWL